MSGHSVFIELLGNTRALKETAQKIDNDISDIKNSFGSIATMLPNGSVVFKTEKETSDDLNQLLKIEKLAAMRDLMIEIADDFEHIIYKYYPSIKNTIEYCKKELHSKEDK